MSAEATGVKRKRSSKMLMSEETKFTWEVENFRGMIAAATNDGLKDAGYVFEAGQSIGLPTTWKLYLEKTENKLGLHMKLLTCLGEVPKVKAAWGFKTLKIGNKYDHLYPADEYNLHGQSTWGWENAFFSLDNFAEDHLENGSLVISIKFTLLKEVIPDGQYKRMKFQQESRDGAVADFQKILDSGEDAEVTLKMADGRTLKAHAVFLKARSHVFAAMLQTDMQEAATGIVRIEDVSYEIMKRILTFIYTGTLEDKWEEVVEELVYAANKYELLVLLKFFDENMSTTCTPENAWTLMDFAKLHGLKTAEDEIAEYFRSHLEEILQAKKAQD